MSGTGPTISPDEFYEKNEVSSPKGKYITVFLTLTFLTVVEVFIPSVYASEYDHNLKMLLLVFLAVGKAILVALFFMHLDHEKPWVKFIAVTPVYMGVFAILLMLESLYRQVGA